MLYFIINEKSKSGESAGAWREIQAVLRKHHMEYKAWHTEYEGHAFSLAKEICEARDDDICLVTVGGDGTVNEVINGMTRFEKVRFGVVPTGSGNDFVRGLGMKGRPGEHMERIISCIKKGRDAAWEMDLGEVSWDGGASSRLFAISSGVGMDALVCKKALKSRVKDLLNKIHMGKLTYLVLTVQSLFAMETTAGAAWYDKRGQRNMGKVIFIAAMNFRAEGGGVPMAPDADARDGKLSICAAFGIPKWRTFLCLPFLVAAKHLWIRGFEVTDCKSSRIRLKKPMVLHADGEYCGEVTEVQYRCLPGKLRVLREEL